MAHLTLSLLGGFVATHDGRPLVGFASDKVRALLAYLAVESDRAHRRQSLATMFWPDWPESAALTNLRHALSNLRQVLGDDTALSSHLLIVRDSVQFDPASDHELDIAQFNALANAAAPDYQSWEQAAALYRGDFLQGFAPKGCDAFEEWAGLLRDRVRRQLLMLLGRLAEREERQGQRSKAIEYAARRAQMEPWEEEGQRELMRLLALDGQRGAALAQYESCRRALQEELGVESSDETRLLYEHIRDGELDATRPEHRPLDLPVSLIPLVGRKEELARLEERLSDPTCRLLTVLGPGGCGKTRLAAEAVAQIVTQYPDGVHFAPLAAAQSVESLVQAIAQAISFSFYATPGAKSAPKQQLLDYLREKHLLLILDSFEHLTEGAVLVMEILAAAPQVRVLVTSRARLSVQGEQLFPLAGLPLPSEAGRETDADGALDLFVQAARRVRPDYQPTEQETEAIAHICRLVEGLPLALLLAASWMEALSPDEIALQIERSGADFLQAEWPDAPERHRSMRAVLDQSWKLIRPREQGILMALAVLLGSFTLAAAHQVAGMELRDLMYFIGRSLLQRTSEGRYVLHDLMRQYLVHGLTQSPEALSAAQARHAAFFGQALQEWDHDVIGARQNVAVHEMTRELDNILAAWEWAIVHDQAAWLDRAARPLGCFYALQLQRVTEAESAFRRAAEQLRSNLDADSTGPRLRALGNLLAWLVFFVGQVRLDEHTCEIAEESIALSQRAEQAGEDTLIEQSLAYRLLAQVLPRGREGEKEGILRRALALAREARHQSKIVAALGALGNYMRPLGRPEEGRRLLEEALPISREVGAPRETAQIMLSLYWLSWQEGRQNEMERWAREMAAIDLRDMDRFGVTWFRRALGGMYYALGEFGQARAPFEESLRITRELGARVEMLNILFYLSSITWQLGRYAEARAYGEELLALARQLDHKTGLYQANAMLGWVAAAEGSLREAEQYANEALPLGQYWDGGVESLLILVPVLCRQGRLAEAQERASELLRLFVGKPQLAGGIPNNMPLFALLYATCGQVERAVELYALAMRYPIPAHSQPLEDIAGRPIKELAASLPAEVVAAAQERGRQRDPMQAAKELLAELEKE